MNISRKDFLVGAGGLSFGVVSGAIATRRLGTAPAPAKVEPSPPAPQGEESFSQCGEDRIIHFLCGYLGINKIDYIDVGAHDPVQGNNTYLFYRKGHRGLLIEPNVEMCRKIRRERPEDRVLEAGIGVTDAREADYYVMTDSSWNTFSKEEAERQAAISNGRVALKEVVKMPLLNINRVMHEHFREAPAFLSVDVQGLELAILKSIDYSRFRPKVICVETLITGTRQMVTDIGEFMATQEYAVRGMSFVNSIFVDSKLI